MLQNVQMGRKHTLAPKQSGTYEMPDGCAMQHRSALALYLLSVVAAEFNSTIDRAIGAPGHGKDVVDGLSTHDKIYQRHKMCGHHRSPPRAAA